VFSPLGIGAAGAVTHNLIQLIVAAIITATKGVLFYAAPLIFSGLICGILTGLAAGMIEKKIKKVI
jgi:heptaprenyl diphosphate synthase